MSTNVTIPPPPSSSVGTITTALPRATSTTVVSTTSSTVTTLPPTTTAPPPPSRPVLAWQPSHQDDTGTGGWHEYRICGDIAKRVMALVPERRHALAWETDMGLTGSNNTGSNPQAFDSEVKEANQAEADYFISLHVDGAAPSGILGMYFSGDERSARVAEVFARSVSEATGLPYRGIRGAPLYSLHPERNDAPVRVLLELGDNAQDRAFLESTSGREKIAQGLAVTARTLEVPSP